MASDNLNVLITYQSIWISLRYRNAIPQNNQRRRRSRSSSSSGRMKSKIRTHKIPKSTEKNFNVPHQTIRSHIERIYTHQMQCTKATISSQIGLNWDFGNRAPVLPNFYSWFATCFSHMAYAKWWQWFNRLLSYRGTSALSHVFSAWQNARM